MSRDEISDKAFPIATDDKLGKEILDLVQEACNYKQLKKGANEATKTLNRETAQLIVLAGDCNPIEILLHLPMLCEDKNVPYIFVPSKASLGRAAGVARNVIAVSIIKSEGDQIVNKVEALKLKIERLLI